MTLEQLFAAVLGVPVQSLADSSSPASIASWDSMKTMNLVAALEEAHAIELSTAEIRALDSLGAARAMLASRGIVA
ncbi:MAG TPA: acyl carrier protein [Kofleriaceae bacterium]